MPDQTLNPTANETPASGIGGNAVTGASNTGHGSTITSHGPSPGTTTKSCRWLTFQSPAGFPDTLTLKVDWTEEGNLDPGPTSNSFEIQYSLNGGSSWSNLLSHSNVITPNNGTASIALSLDQNISQVQVRDIMTATGATLAGADITTSISNVRLEIEYRTNKIILGMM